MRPFRMCRTGVAAAPKPEAVAALWLRARGRRRPTETSQGLGDSEEREIQEITKSGHQVFQDSTSGRMAAAGDRVCSVTPAVEGVSRQVPMLITLLQGPTTGCDRQPPFETHLRLAVAGCVCVRVLCSQALVVFWRTFNSRRDWDTSEQAEWRHTISRISRTRIEHLPYTRLSRCTCASRTMFLSQTVLIKAHA